ncbi:tRNA pseudouridine(55) synthase TruB [Paenibacillus protaetiae]|uniref:tRNA pseudouridine synthase B n=1 Tax=Paenibacillus protaetiae TaxID=2509456 RepID=A0A4P6EYB4_9BACL|nr:tRNA pseudouridine(55) synthase TruB [Paenibacillus protaetiae]QAY65637.1 tRNA pseudouridine(55) synthase TruB [Paenibacillus protaetiae]
MDGILPVWKPAGWTSHDVVAKVRGITKIKRIGHAGTLDPMVTGVLPLCIGRATRVVEYLQDRPKAYEAVLKLGIATDTEDMTGTVLKQEPHIQVTEAEVTEALNRFVGQIEQIPPMFSAVKVDGKRLYELAREGKTVERKSRTVTIYGIQLLQAALDQEYPEIRFSAVCSKGTYIRTLCVDIGQALGVPAVMAELVRTMSGGITKEDCLTLEEIADRQQQGTLSDVLLPSDTALSHMERIDVNEETADKGLKGQKISLARLPVKLAPDKLVTLYAPDDKFVGVFRADPAAGALRPEKVFN